MLEKKETKAMLAWLDEIGVTPVEPPSQKRTKAERVSAKKADKSKRSDKKATAKRASVGSPEYGYPNFALCVVDAVFSGGSRSAASRQVCALVEWAARTGMKPSATGRKLTPGMLAARLEGIGVGDLTDTVFECATPALGCPELSRAQLVVELCRNLDAEGVSTKVNARDTDKREAISRAVKATRGFGASGEAQLLTLAHGPVEDSSAVDALRAAVPEILGREIDEAEAVELKDKVMRRLRKSMPGLSEADVVHHLWRAGAGFGPGFTCARQ